MALDLGELSARVALDIDPVRKGVGDAKGELGTIEPAAAAAGGEAGTSLGREFADKGKTAMAAAGVALVGAMGYGLHEAMGRESASGRLAAQLGLDAKEQERLGRIAGTLYSNAYGDSVAEVTDAVAAVRSSLGEGSSKELRRLTADALNLAATFEYDVGRSAQVAGQLVRTGLVDNAGDAFDLITRGSQSVPAAVREDLLDAADEYGQFFQALGFGGKEAFDALVQGAEDGMYGIDKTGDAIKEFTIRSTDMSTTSKDAFGALGMDARAAADDVLAGGDRARGALDDIIDGLLSMESPSRRAQTAIALFGTPLEDLNVSEIPAFLRNLRDTSDGMEDVRGAAKRMGDAVNDTAEADFKKLKRSVDQELYGLMKDVLPFVRDEFVPALEGIGDAFDSIPDWAVKAGGGGLLAALAAGKVGSIVGDISKLRGGLTGGLGSAVSKASPVPVYVVNDLPGGGGGGIAGGTTKGGMARNLARLIPTALVADAGYEIFWGDTYGLRDGSNLDKQRNDPEGFARLGAPRVLDGPDFTSGFGSLVDEALKTAAEVAEAFSKLPKELRTDIALNGVPESMREARELARQYDLTPRKKETFFELLGYETTMSRLSNIERAALEASQDRRLRIAVDLGYQTSGGLQERAGGGPVAKDRPYLVGEREPELFVPDTAGRILNQKQMQAAGIGGPSFHIDQVVAQDFRDFMGQATRMHQQANLGGRPAGS